MADSRTLGETPLPMLMATPSSSHSSTIRPPSTLPWMIPLTETYLPVAPDSGQEVPQAVDAPWFLPGSAIYEIGIGWLTS
jgi:hypothetical protein